MTLMELTAKVQFVTDAEGNRQAVMLDLVTWEELLSELRWEELFNDPRSPELLDRLASEAQAEHEAGRTIELDPDTL